MKMNLLIAALTSLVLVSCAHQEHATMRGSVAMKMGADTAHVCMGNNEVKAGDRVVAFKNVCKNNQTDINTRSHLKTYCSKEKVGEGTVVATLNEHYSEVKFDQGVEFQEGTIVEKAK